MEKSPTTTASMTSAEITLFHRLLPDRKLKTFLQRPLDILPESKDGSSLLLFWCWEGNLKKRLLPDRKLKTFLQCPLDILPESKDGSSLLLF
ncbi:hypothetical protein ZOSMA_28G00650 [Zostera marina]|uniref:Uncharacterized protein n=1 Tax=Zostera marina TaxID=29655 RepID=A0A0K9PER8_ZOSMR|nr:hypothetical protein ZOSMA_28G00650 [Zostera marina]